MTGVAVHGLARPGAATFKGYWRETVSRMLVGGVLALFAGVAAGHATVKEEGELKDGRAYVVIKPDTGPCPEGFMRIYREIIPGVKKMDRIGLRNRIE